MSVCEGLCTAPTFTDDLCVPFIGGEVDAEGDEFGVRPVLTALKHHLHYLSFKRETSDGDSPLLEQTEVWLLTTD